MAHLQHCVMVSIGVLNTDQCGVFNEVEGAVMPGTSTDNLKGAYFSIVPHAQPTAQSVFFLDSPGETGKTFFIGAIHEFLQARGRRFFLLLHMLLRSTS